MLGITRDDYALCDYVRYRCADPRQKKGGWCEDPKDEIADFVGITRPGLYKMAARMKALDLLEIGENGAYRVTAKWIDAEAGCKLSLHKTKDTGVNLVDTESKLSLQKKGLNCKPSLQTPIKDDSLVGDSVNNSENEFPTTSKPENSEPQKPEAKAKKTSKPAKSKEPDRSIQEMVLAFEAEHKKHFKDAAGEWLGFTWQGKEFPALVKVKGELSKRFREKMNKDATDEDIVSSWKLFLEKAAKCDKWILENCYSPSKLWSQFQTVIEKIHHGNGTSTSKGNADRRKSAAESLIKRSLAEDY